MIRKTTQELETALVAELGIERLFSVENEFQTCDGTVAQPIPVLHGMLLVSVYHRCRDYEHPYGFEVDDRDVQSIKDYAAKVGANAAEIGSGSASKIPLQLYRIEK